MYNEFSTLFSKKCLDYIYTTKKLSFGFGNTYPYKAVYIRFTVFKETGITSSGFKYDLQLDEFEFFIKLI